MLPVDTGDSSTRGGVDAAIEGTAAVGFASDLVGAHEGAVDAAGHVVLGPNTTVDGAVTAGRTVRFGDGASFVSIDAARVDESPAADLWPEHGDGSTGG